MDESCHGVHVEVGRRRSFHSGIWGLISGCQLCTVYFICSAICCPSSNTFKTCMCICAHTCVTLDMWRPQDSLQESALSTVYILELKLWLADSTASTFPYWAISPACHFQASSWVLFWATEAGFELLTTPPRLVEFAFKLTAVLSPQLS